MGPRSAWRRLSSRCSRTRWASHRRSAQGPAPPPCPRRSRRSRPRCPERWEPRPRSRPGALRGYRTTRCRPRTRRTWPRTHHARSARIGSNRPPRGATRSASRSRDPRRARTGDRLRRLRTTTCAIEPERSNERREQEATREHDPRAEPLQETLHDEYRAADRERGAGHRRQPSHSQKASSPNSSIDMAFASRPIAQNSTEVQPRSCATFRTEGDTSPFARGRA